MGNTHLAHPQTPPKPAPPKSKQSEWEQDMVLWKGCAKIIMRSGLEISVVKVVSVKRYVLLVVAENYETLVLISKHAVDMVVMKPQVAQRPQA